MQYYQELAKREGMDDVSIDVTMLNDQMRMILKEADYMKARVSDVCLRSTVEGTLRL
jgi:hypothetical protein